MDADERAIFQYLKSWGTQFINPREIARRAGPRKRFHEEPDWAKNVLVRMEERGIVEHDIMGRYRLKPMSVEDKKRYWGAPDAAPAPEEGGVEGGNAAAELGPDEYYEQL
jgi:hypothetical protein